MKKWTKEELEQNISRLNKWLFEYGKSKSSLYKHQERCRNYYVNKLIELEEYGRV